MNKLKNQHILYPAAFITLYDVMEEGGIRTVINGKVVLFKFYVGMIVCDTVGANEFCCHYNSTGKSLIQCLCKCCHCGFDDLITVPPQCKPITRVNVTRSLVDTDTIPGLFLSTQYQVHSMNCHWLTPFVESMAFSPLKICT